MNSASPPARDDPPTAPRRDLADGSRGAIPGEPEQSAPRVVIADDQTLVRTGFRMILSEAGISKTDCTLEDAYGHHICTWTIRCQAQATQAHQAPLSNTAFARTVHSSGLDRSAQ